MWAIAKAKATIFKESKGLIVERQVTRQSTIAASILWIDSERLWMTMDNCGKTLQFNNRPLRMNRQWKNNRLTTDDNGGHTTKQFTFQYTQKTHLHPKNSAVGIIINMSAAKPWHIYNIIFEWIADHPISNNFTCIVCNKDPRLAWYCSAFHNWSVGRYSSERQHLPFNLL